MRPTAFRTIISIQVCLTTRSGFQMCYDLTCVYLLRFHTRVNGIWIVSRGLFCFSVLSLAYAIICEAEFKRLHSKHSRCSWLSWRALWCIGNLDDCNRVQNFEISLRVYTRVISLRNPLGHRLDWLVAQVSGWIFNLHCAVSNDECKCHPCSCIHNWPLHRGLFENTKWHRHLQWFYSCVKLLKYFFKKFLHTRSIIGKSSNQTDLVSRRLSGSAVVSAGFQIKRWKLQDAAFGTDLVLAVFGGTVRHGQLRSFFSCVKL